VGATLPKHQCGPAPGAVKYQAAAILHCGTSLEKGGIDHGFLCVVVSLLWETVADRVVPKFARNLVERDLPVPTTTTPPRE
jgi:hypothetical protein